MRDRSDMESTSDNQAAFKNTGKLQREYLGLRGFLSDASRLLTLLAAILLNLFLWLAFFFRIGFGDAVTVIRYNAYFGIDLTGNASQVFLIPGAALLMFGLHLVLSLIFFRWREPFLSFLLLLSALLLQIGALIVVIALLLVN